VNNNCNDVRGGRVVGRGLLGSRTAAGGDGTRDGGPGVGRWHPPEGPVAAGREPLSRQLLGGQGRAGAAALLPDGHQGQRRTLRPAGLVDPVRLRGQATPHAGRLQGHGHASARAGP
jgi:hypothetical protein